MKTFQISIKETQQNFPCSSDESVFAAMVRFQKYAVSHGCCGGGCGICKMSVLSGEFVKFKKMSRAHVSETEEIENVVLLCCIKPRSDLLISKGKGE